MDGKKGEARVSSWYLRKADQKGLPGGPPYTHPGCSHVLKRRRCDALNQKAASEQVALRDVDSNTIQKDEVK